MKSESAHPPHDAAHYWRMFRRLGPAGPLAVIAASLPLVAAATILSLISRLAPWMREHHELGLLLYIGGFTVLGGLALLPTWVHSILGGWAFGAGVGLLAAMASFLGASAVAYGIGRWAAGNRVVGLVEENRKAKAVYDALLRSGWGRSLLIVTLVRLSPNSPFAITNLAFAAARVPMSVFWLGTALGLAPRTAIAVFFGSKLSELSFDTPKWLIVAGIVVTLAVLAVIAQIANRALAQITAEPGQESPPAGT